LKANHKEPQKPYYIVVHLEIYDNFIGFNVAAININSHFLSAPYDPCYGYFMKNFMYVCKNEFLYIGESLTVGLYILKNK